MDFVNNTIFVRHLKKDDECVLLKTKALRGVIERRYETRNDKRVFPAKGGKDTDNAQWAKTIATRAGIDFEAGKVTSHTFRHSAPTRLLRLGICVQAGVIRVHGHAGIVFVKLIIYVFWLSSGPLTVLLSNKQLLTILAKLKFNEAKFGALPPFSLSHALS